MADSQQSRSATWARKLGLLILGVLAGFLIAEIILRAAEVSYPRFYVVDQHITAGQMGLLAAQLLTALDETQIFKTLTDFLPQVNIEHVAVAFYQSDSDDPAAWSELHAGPTQTKIPLRFLSREFPPPELYPSERPYSLALLPLMDQEEKFGFIAFKFLNKSV